MLWSHAGGTVEFEAAGAWYAEMSEAEVEADDDPGVLTNNSLAPGGWYCSGARAPQRFEVMDADVSAMKAFIARNATPA